MTQEVEDKKLELGINLSVIIQGLILLSVAGFGNYIHNGLGELNVNIKELTKEIASINMATTVNSIEIKHNRAAIQNLNNEQLRTNIKIDEHVESIADYKKDAKNYK